MTAVHAEPDRATPARPATGATRHLCSGVYVDEGFRELVIDEVCTAPERRVAPSYGFDHVPVMRHAWWATHLHAFLRLTMLASVIAPHLLGHTVASVLTTGGLVVLFLLDRAAHLYTVITREDDPLSSPREQRNKKKQRRRLFPLPGTLDVRTRDEARRLKTTGLQVLAVVGAMALLCVSQPAQALVAAYAGGGVLLVSVLVGVIGQLRVNRVYVPGSILRPERLSAREKVVDHQQTHPCVVYQRPVHKGNEEDKDDALFTLFGKDSPFVGAGELVYQWNPPMSVQLLRPGGNDEPLHEREHRYPPFRTDELVEHLREAVDQLCGDDEDVRLPVSVRDRIYVAASDISGDRSLTRGSIGPGAMRRVINEQRSGHFHFLEVSVPDADSELVATVLLHVVLRGRTLSLFFAACALTRTPDRFRRAEEFGQHGKRAVAAAGFRALRDLPHEVTGLWRVVRYPWVLAKALLYRRDLTTTPIRNLSIGSRVSVRQEIAQKWSKVQLDKTRVLSHMKTVEQRLLKATSDFLHSRGVDISEFDDRATQIINSGIVNLGGTNDISNNNLGNGTQTNNHGPQQTSQNGDQT
ncbi:hypothetical protein [Nocardiopsis sp. NPDC006938]|uniref:hypothetical protein n=1 Tax=Nocardiopsis sp. NPDC006938 TaxID=3364337 RepID=UPI0036855714